MNSIARTMAVIGLALILMGEHFDNNVHGFVGCLVVSMAIAICFWDWSDLIRDRIEHRKRTGYFTSYYED